MAIPLRILPDDRVLDVAPGTTILRAAHAGGVDITATCGGRGRCTSCRVKFLAGTIPPPSIMDELQLGADLVRDGYRLSCQCAVTEPITVQVTPALDEHAFQILGAGEGVAGRVAIESGIVKQVVKVSLPREEHHQTSDLEELLAGIGRTPAEVPVELLRTLPAALREGEGEVTVASFGPTVIAVERGDTALMKFGLAIDVGTTSLVTTLIELESGEQLASVSSLNPQAVFGGDLMSRIAFAQFNPRNLRTLRTRIVGALNQHIAQICAESGVLAKWIHKLVVVGNTGMHHLLLGIDPSYVGLAPYAPVLRHPLVLPARELLLKVAPEARVCFLPIVAGFVGADAVAVALATRIGDTPELRIAVDIGTNGEVLLGSRERLWACSAPAGPALEGAQIRHGMRGAAGAIDRVRVDADGIHMHTIGDAAAQGICGSGLIDLLAGLLEAGVIDWTGLIDLDRREALPPALAARVRMVGEERQVVVLRPGEAGAAQEIVLTQDDVRQVQLAKGAIASGVAMLQHVAEIPAHRITELMLAGGFGNYMSIASALRIGLIPPMPVEKIRYVGNAAALGAQLCLVSEPQRARAEALARFIEHVSLAAHPDFQDIFVDCMNFPRPGILLTLGSGAVGTEVGPVTHAIDARWLMAYAAGLGETDPRYYDTRAPAGPLAHPLFPVCYEWPLALALRERVAGRELELRAVHAQHHLTLHRLPRAGDVLSTRARVLAVIQRPPGALMVVRYETVDARNLPVTTTDYGSLYRGVALDGPDRCPPGWTPDPPRSPTTLPVVATVVVSATQAHVYTECARIWNPIHTDAAVATRVGLPGIILHGTATLALTTSAVLAALGQDPARVREVAARFAGMVPMPSTLTVKASLGTQGSVHFETVGTDGKPAINRASLTC